MIRFWHSSLRIRVLLPAALVAIPALILLVYMSVQQRREAESDITRNAEQLARIATVDQERLIEGTRQLLIALSQSRDVREAREGNVEGCNSYLNQLIRQYGSTYNNIGFADSDGMIVCSGFGTPVSIANREYFTGALATRDFAAGAFGIGRQTGRPSLQFGYPVMTATGGVSGVVFAAVDLNRLNEGLTDRDWPRDANLIVTDRQNTIVAKHPDWQSWLGQSLAHDPITKLIGNRVTGTIDFAEKNSRELFAFSRITKPAGTGLTVRVFIDKTEAMAAADRAMYEGLVAIGLVAMLVMAGVTAASERLLMEPIDQLAKASRRLADGDLGARAASSTAIPELNELGKDFDHMAAALQEREAARLRVEMERKELEQQYHQAQKMDAVGRLAGGIAHDFNNMLTAILGYCELLLEDQSTTDSQRSDIREIDRAGRTAATLTRQLLAFSRREIVEPKVISLNTVVSSMDKMLHLLLGENIEIEGKLTRDLDFVKADQSQLEQVVLNLMVNARDAMASGGRVRIETANVNAMRGITSSYLAAPAGRYVMLAVADEGCGISSEVKPHLFEPFFTTKGAGKGTGLGLATIYGIVKQNGGGISVDSEIGRGSVFRIYLRRTDDRPVEARSEETVTISVPGKATILVVEDDSGIRELASKVLSRYGYEVLTACGGDEAGTVSNGHDGPIDILLSDVVMPGMSGPKVAAMLTASRPAMKVVYMSGYTDDAIVRHGVMAHDVPFIQKPFTPERLHNKILEVLSN